MTGRNGAKKEFSKPKIIIVMVLFGLVLSALWVRAGWVQLHEGEALERMASRQSLASELEFGRRGRIFDRNGTLLASSAEARSVFANPRKVRDPEKTAHQLRRLLGVSFPRIHKRLASDRQFVWIKRQVTDRQAATVRKARIPGVRMASEFTRLYPNGPLAGQVLGFTGIDGKGLEGIESEFEKRLAPGKARFVVQRDASGRRLYLNDQGEVVDIDGLDVTLTIDARVQHAAEEALYRAIEKHEAKAGIVIAADVKSGEILAMANYPFFNPNIYSRTRPADRRNRAVLDLYEPGSTLKPILFAAAIEEGVIEPNTLIDCENGRWRVGRKVIRDHHYARWLPARKVLRYSSNIGCAKIGQMLGADAYYSYLVKLGFLERPETRLPAMRSGMLRPPEKWTEVDQAAISFGQGISSTALQLMEAYMCIAAGGETRSLRLVQTPDSPAARSGERVFSRQTAATVLKLMEEVVEKDGTGRRARIPGIAMAGKTGTAQKAVRGGYGDKYMSSFVGMVPAEDPELLILCMVDEPEGIDYGGIVAAPVVRSVLVETLALRGQLPDAHAVRLARKNAPGTEVVEPASESVRAVLPAPVTLAPGTRIPDVKGMPLRRALEVFLKKGIVPTVRGDGMTVTGQTPAPGEPWPEPEEEARDDVFVLQLS